GVHRTLARLPALRAATVLLVVAGMEGALPSLVAGLVDRPVIAVPTSIGYGASLGGLAALLGMLTSCAAAVTAVNIDTGYGAACAAALINRKEPCSRTCICISTPRAAPPATWPSARCSTSASPRSRSARRSPASASPASS